MNQKIGFYRPPVVGPMIFIIDSRFLVIYRSFWIYHTIFKVWKITIFIGYNIAELRELWYIADICNSAYYWWQVPNLTVTPMLQMLIPQLYLMVWTLNKKGKEPLKGSWRPLIFFSMRYAYVAKAHPSYQNLGRWKAYMEKFIYFSKSA